jgi:hypothetical protein
MSSNKEKVEIASKECYDNTIVSLREDVPDSVEAFFSLHENPFSHFMAVHLEEVCDSPSFLIEYFVNSGNIPMLLFEDFATVCWTNLDAFPEQASIVSGFSCRDCNQVYDIPFQDVDEDGDEPLFGDDSHPRVFIDEVTDNINPDLTAELLHRLTLTLQLLVTLLTSPTLLTNEQKNSLENQLLMQTPKERVGIAAQSFLNPNVFPLLDMMVHFLHTNNYHYPLVAQNVAALLSLLIVKRPANLLSKLGSDQFICCIGMHVKQIREQITNNSTLPSVRFSILGYLNILPTLWNMTNTYTAQIQQFGLHEDLADFVIQLLGLTGRAIRCARGKCLCYLTDEAMDYTLQHALFLCVCPVKQCFAVEPQLVDDHPLTLATVATIQVLVKWQECFGISISKLKYNDEHDFGSQFVKRSEYLQQAIAQERIPSLAFGYDLLMNHLAKSQESSNENTITSSKSNSVFCRNVVRCHESSCLKMNQLSECSGCHVALYCCSEHQKDQWKAHRSFCKAVRAAAREVS